MPEWHYCPDEESCDTPYNSCPALADNGQSTHLNCDIFKAKNYFDTATDMLDVIDKNGSEHKQIRPYEIKAKQSGINPEKMPPEMVEECIEKISKFRKWANRMAEKAVKIGCQVDKDISELNELEDLSTETLRHYKNSNKN